MRKKTHIFLLLSTIILLNNCKKNNVSDCNCVSVVDATDKYTYPIKAGSAAWNAAGAAGGIDSIYKISQVPLNRLQSMSTLALIQTLETNPTLFNMLLRDNKIFGRNEVLSRLNVSWELNKRNDAGQKMVEYYNQKNPCCIESIPTDIGRGRYANDWYLSDMICTQDSLISKLTLSGKKNFAKIVINKYIIQLKYPDTFGSTKTSSILILSNILIAADNQPYLNALLSNNNLNFFANTGIIASGVNLNDVINYANAFTNF